MKNIFYIILSLTILNSNCVSVKTNELKRPPGVPEKAAWMEKEKQWGLRYDDGTANFWYPNGNKAQHIKIINGKLNGFCISWYENGNKKMEGMYKDGLMTGEWKYWWPSGKIKAIGNLMNDKADGLWELFHEDGQKKAELIYKDGVKISEKAFSKQ